MVSCTQYDHSEAVEATLSVYILCACMSPEICRPPVGTFLAESFASFREVPSTLLPLILQCPPPSTTRNSTRLAFSPYPNSFMRLKRGYRVPSHGRFVWAPKPPHPSQRAESQCLRGLTGANTVITDRRAWQGRDGSALAVTARCKTIDRFPKK